MVSVHHTGYIIKHDRKLSSSAQWKLKFTFIYLWQIVLGDFSVEMGDPQIKSFCDN